MPMRGRPFRVGGKNAESCVQQRCDLLFSFKLGIRACLWSGLGKMLWKQDSYGHAQKLWFVFGVPTVDGNNHGLGFKGWSPLCPGAETVATSSEHCPHPHPQH